MQEHNNETEYEYDDGLNFCRGFRNVLIFYAVIGTLIYIWRY